ncbi:MAG: hypothetical protein EBR82_00200 [Caulobacteraceae bacterium]|nr:hypothetical protein [Caulobacteraceae bacterium]
MSNKPSKLRRIFSEALDEEAWLPGRWYPDGDPVDPDEIELMGTDGLGKPVEEDDDLNEGVRLTVDNLRRTTFDVVQRKFPEFAAQLTGKYGPRSLATASFALASQGFLGGNVPLVAFAERDLPIAYWDGDMIRYNTSTSLASAVEDAP